MTATPSNYHWEGYQCWDTVDYESLDAVGPWFDYTAYGVAQGIIYSNKALSTGKVYFNYNYRDDPTQVEYCFGLVTPDHDKAVLPGFSAESWAFCTESVGFYHNSIQTVTGDAYLDGITTSTPGYWYSYTGYYHRDNYIILVAIDFDAGKIWFGTFNGSIETWYGDPAAGTGEAYSFTPNTPLIPAIGYKLTHSGFYCTAMFQIAASRDYARREPPTGFSFIDEFDYQTEVLADSPVGYWLAGPHIYDESYRINSLGYNSTLTDSSLNQKYAEHYQLSVYNTLTLSGQRIFPAQPNASWYAAHDTTLGKYACSFNSQADFSFEVSIYVTGDGASNDTNDTWIEGSGLFCNYYQASLQASFTLGDLWVGMSLRARRLKFGLDTFEVTSTFDLDNGAYHVIGTFDYSAQLLTLYINGAEDNQTTSVTPASKMTSHINVGTIKPTQTNGNFPGYFRDVAFYPTTLSSTRVAAHYAQLQQGYMAEPIAWNRDKLALQAPSFIL